MSRIAAQAWLRRLDAARELALPGEDPEGVHQVRVAARRLRVWLRLDGDASLEPELRWLCRALSAERDLDVLGVVLRGEGVAPLRAEARAQVVEALRSERYAALREALGQRRGPRRKDARRVAKRLLRALERRRAALPDPVTVEALDEVHALRRALRRARYAREWLGQDARGLAREQEQLGAVCDLCALRRRLAPLAPDALPIVAAGLERAVALLASRPKERDAAR